MVWNMIYGCKKAKSWCENAFRSSDESEMKVRVYMTVYKNVVITML